MSICPLALVSVLSALAWDEMAARKLPETFRKLVISKFTTNYREAVELMTLPLMKPGPNELLVKNR